MRKLSGGEQAKAQFIRTIVLNKDYILLDEPMASLDSQSRQLVENKMRELRKQKKTIILITHDFIQAKELGDEIIFMENLKVVGTYSPREFFKNIL